MNAETSHQPLPRVIIDARMVTEIPHGLARYVVQMAKGLEEQDQISKLKYKPIFLISPELKKSPFGPFDTHLVNIPFLSPSEIFEIPKVLQKLKPALYHSPSFSSIWRCPCPSIITIHDLNHLTYGDLLKKIYYETVLRRFALRSRGILTVSRFAQQELADWLKIPSQNIEIVYNSIDASFAKPEDHTISDALLKKLNLKSGQYFFCLSNPKPHKNVSILVQAYEKFRREQPAAWPLVLSVNEYAGIEGIKSVGPLAEKEATSLLSNAGGMLFPSLYEGFGLPPVEAAVSGVRLAISKIPPHQEGLVDLNPNEVLWVPPTDLEGWTKAFHRIFNGEVSRPSEEIRKRIMDRFSTTRMGAHMNQIYCSALEGKSV